MNCSTYTGQYSFDAYSLRYMVKEYKEQSKYRMQNPSESLQWKHWACIQDTLGKPSEPDDISEVDVVTISGADR